MLYVGIALIALIIFPELRAFVLLCGVCGLFILSCVIIYVKVFPNEDPCSSFKDTVAQYEYWGNIAENVPASRPFMFNAVEQIEVCENHLARDYREDRAAMSPQESAKFNANRAAILNKVISSYSQLYRIKENQIVRDIKKEQK